MYLETYNSKWVSLVTFFKKMPIFPFDYLIQYFSETRYSFPLHFLPKARDRVRFIWCLFKVNLSSWEGYWFSVNWKLVEVVLWDLNLEGFDLSSDTLIYGFTRNNHFLDYHIHKCSNDEIAYFFSILSQDIF